MVHANDVAVAERQRTITLPSDPEGADGDVARQPQ